MSENLKRLIKTSILGIFAVIVMSALAPTGAGAHAPKTVSLSFDQGTKILTVTVTHTYFSPSHYIDKIEIKKNGAVAVSQGYTSQPSETFTYTYKLDAAKGDTLEVKVVCNKFGSKTEKITLGQG